VKRFYLILKPSRQPGIVFASITRLTRPAKEQWQVAMLALVQNQQLQQQRYFNLF